MNLFKKFGLSLVLLAAAFCAYAETETIDGIEWTYRVVDGKAEIYNNGSAAIGGTYQNSGEITIPSTLGGYPVTSIGENAFSNCFPFERVWSSNPREIVPTFVTIPEGVVNIGRNAFAQENYWRPGQRPMNPDGTYDTYRDYPGLFRVQIPDSVKHIGSNAFGGYITDTFEDYVYNSRNEIKLVDGWVVGCESPQLESVDLTDVRGIVDGALSGLDALKDVTLPVEVFERNVDRIYSVNTGSWKYANGVYQSNDIDDNESTSMSVVMKGPCVFVYDWKVSSEANYDYLTSSLDGCVNESISGISDWQTAYCLVSNEMQTTEWKYSKDGSVSNAEDCGWVRLVGTVNTMATFFPDSYMSITNVVLLGNENTIPPYAFEGCESLESAVVRAQAETETIDGIEWTYRVVDGKAEIYNNGSAAIGGLSRFSGEITIPSSLGGYPVTSIGENAFSNCFPCIYVDLGVAPKPEDCSSFEAWVAAMKAYENACEKMLESIMALRVSITIPDGVVNIGRNAFVQNHEHMERVDGREHNYQCFPMLESITIPASVMTVGEGAFDGCTPTRVTVPGWKCGIDFSSVTDLAISEGTTNIVDSAFEGCSGLTSVTIPDSVTSIGDAAFYYCSGLTTVDLPSTVTNIGSEAFCGCRELRSVSGGEGLKRVGRDAFCDTLFLYGKDSWEEVEANEDYKNDYGLVPIYLGNFIVGRRGSLAEAWNGEYYDEDGNWMWEYKLAILDGTTGIADGLFEELPITSVTIPGSVRRIPENAFQRCSYLKNLTINEGVEEIGAYSFGYAGSNWEEEGITTLTIPSSVIKIEEYAFAQFGNLKYVNGLDDTDDISGDAFTWTPYIDGWEAPGLVIEDGVVTGFRWETRFDDGCITNGTLYIPEGVTAIGDVAFSSLDCFVNIILPESLRDIGKSAFENCSSMEEINIPEGVLNINDSMFSQCSRLVEVKLPSTVTNIGALAFYDCYSLADIAIPENVTSIGEKAFYDCDSLSDIVFPNTLEYIGDYAFDDCNSLSEVVIPSSIKHIGVDAFGYYYSEHHYLKRITIPQALCESNEDNSLRNIGCYGITNLVILPGVTNIGEGVFSDLWSLQSVTIPDSVTFIGGGAFSGCYSLADVTMPESITCIGDYAFDDCDSLVDVTIPENVTSIGYGAFMGCDALQSITIPLSVTNIGEYAFDGCYSLHYAKVPLALKEQVESSEVFCDCPDELVIEYYGNVPLVSPVITPGDGSEFYEDTCTVTISCETEGASIYYTTDGTTPRPISRNLYTEPFAIADTATIKAISVRGDEHSDMVSATITKKELVLAAPVITPADGTEFYGDSCTVTIACATEGASIYYIVCDTNNVTNPRPIARNLYTGPFTVSGTKMVRAFSVFGSKTSDIVAATFIKRELTLPVAVDAPELTFATGGDAEWVPMVDSAAKVGGTLAQSGGLTWSEEESDPSETWMETTVVGAGTFSFWWKVDCEDDPWGVTWDRLEVFTNGVEAARIDGKTEWEQLSFTFADTGAHTIRWMFCKDDWDDEKLTDLAWVDGVVWTPTSTDVTIDVGNGKNVVVPVSWIDSYADIIAAAGGDKAAALQQTAANGRKVWECFMLGVDPTKADDDFRITRFWMENGVPKFEFSHSSDGAGNSFVPRIKTLGKVKLSDSWQEVPSGGNSSFRFFTVEVELP